ncbi:MAG: glycosyltransferase family 39 protein [Candidatus Blackburnbacteria bacterium]|nr:glycosyltransferase family 39 protein [Candidatus Blackburnbacteria bacterium]
MIPYSKLGKYFIASRILFLLFAFLAIFFVPLQEGYIGRQVSTQEASFLTWSWANFDGRHFINIARLGYRNFDFAYFPLYPILISLLGYIVPHVWAGIIISTVALVLAIYVVYKLIELDFSKETANLAVFLILLFPLSFFYHSVYPDSLFLLFSTTSFYFARKDKWWLAGIFCGLTIVTRLSGVALVTALAVEWYLQYKNRPLYLNKLVGALTLGTSGLVGYMVYLWYYFGDPLLFQKSMSAWNQGAWVFPPQVVFRYLKIFFFVNKNLVVYWIAALEFVSFFAYLLLAFFVYKRVRRSYGVFMFVLLLLVTFTGTFAGTPRYMLHLFPGFIGMSLIFQKSNVVKYGLLVLFLALGFVLTGLFTRGYFVG